jgi:arabinogalactan oligomer/maltooligosaccharide transport system permease protein
VNAAARAGALALLLACSAAWAAPPLRLWHAYRGAEEAALEQAVKRFTEDAGTQVELLALPYDAFASKLAAAIPHGVGPDVFLYAHEKLRSFHEKGLLAQADGRLVPGDYLPNALPALQLDGATYGYPLSLKCLALYYDKDRVPSPPATTDEWLRQLGQLSQPAAGQFGLAYEAGDFYFHAPFLFGFGGQLFDEAGHARFTGKPMEDSLAFVLGLHRRGYLPEEASGALVKSLFNARRVAMVVSGPWFAGEIAPELNWGVAPLPTVSSTGLPLSPFLGVEAAFVSSRSQQMAGAQALAHFLSVGDGAYLRATVGKQVPADTASHRTEAVKRDVFISRFKDAASHAVPMPHDLELQKMWEPMKLALRALLQGGALPQDAGALADRRYRALHRPPPPDAPVMPWAWGALAVLSVAAGWAFVTRSREPFHTRYPEAWRGLAYVAPAATGVAVLILVPFSVGIGLSLFHHEPSGAYRFVGLANFADILQSRGYAVTEPLSFYFTLGVTVAWALVNVVLHVGIGLLLALVLKDPLLRLRGVYRVLLILPWAIPNYITALMWKGLFHRQFGAINALLVALGVEPVSWFTRFSTAFAANVVTNTWLGFPFMMVVSLGALQSIPQDLYEAAEVDGASKWVQFRRITLPLLRPALLPSVILGSVWTFNMFNIIYLVSGGEPGGATDILVSEAYRWAFQRNEQYGFAAAYSVLIFAVLWLYTTATKRFTAAEAA